MLDGLNYQVVNITFHNMVQYLLEDDGHGGSLFEAERHDLIGSR